MYTITNSGGQIRARIQWSTKLGKCILKSDIDVRWDSDRLTEVAEFMDAIKLSVPQRIKPKPEEKPKEEPTGEQ